MTRAATVVLVLLLLATGLPAGQRNDTPDIRLQTLQMAVALLAATMAAVFEAAGEEDVSPAFRATLQEAIEVCMRVLAALGYVR